MNFEKLFTKAKEKNIVDIQVHFVADTKLDIEVLKGELENYTISDTKGLSVKGIYDGKMGTVSTEVINDDMIDYIVDSIIASANNIDSEDEVFIYGGDSIYQEVDDLYNQELEEIDAKTKIDLAFDLEKAALATHKYVNIVQGFYSEVKHQVRILNSKGLDLSKKVNSATAGAYVIATDGKDQRTGIEYIQSNVFEDFDVDKIAKKGSKNAVDAIGAKSIKSGDYEIILENKASASLLAAHTGMFSAESVQKDVSLLKGKVGEKISSNLISIVDDPFMKKSPRSGSFDDEGVATKYKELVKDGKLTGYLHNLKTAKKDEVGSTGNGFRNGISPTNFYIVPGKTSFEDSVKSVKKGLIISDLQGTHAGTSSVSGDFSLQASGYLVEDGKIIRPVSMITVAGNYLELLQDVTEICNDLKMNFGFIGSPSIKIKALAIAGDE
jgi:PmbA protein